VHVFRLELVPCLLGELADLAEQVDMLAQRGKIVHAGALLESNSRHMPDFPELNKMRELLAKTASRPKT